MALDVDAARPVRNNPHDIRRERRMMRAFQNPILGPLLRRFGGPEDIVQMGMSFWSSRLILSAVEAGVFTELANGRQYEHELADALGWHPRAAGTALDALVAAGLLRRDRAGRYANTIRGATFLDRSKPSYVGGLMELSSASTASGWSWTTCCAPAGPAPKRSEGTTSSSPCCTRILWRSGTFWRE